MRSLLIKIFFKTALIGLGWTHLSWAEYTFDKNYCFISKSFEISYNNENVTGLFQMAFSPAPVTLPVMNLSFTGKFKPDDLSISWKSAKVTNRNGNPLFDSDFMQHLNTTEKVFPFYRNGAEVYYSPAYGFIGSRIFISMFLSQVDMELNYQFAGQDEKQTLISLTGSDQTFREFAKECYKQQTEEFLNQHATRRKGLPESWSLAYGMLNHPIAENLQEGNYLLKEEYKKDIPKSYEFYAKLYPVLQRKSDLLKTIDDVEQGSDIKDTLDKIKNIIALTQQKQQRIIQLSSTPPASPGLIQELKAQIQQIQIEQLALDQRINQLKSEQIEVKDAELSQLTDSNDILLAQVKVYEDQILLVKGNISQAETRLNQFYEAYGYISTKIEETDLQRLQSLKYSGPPMAYEEIQSKLTEVSDLEMKIISLQILLEDIRSLEPDLKESVERYNKALASYQEYLVLQKDGVQKKHEIQLLQRLKSKNFDELQISTADLVATNQIIDAELPESRSLDDEKSGIINALRETNSAFDQIVSVFEENSQLILSQIICRSNIFRADVNDYCLTASDLIVDSEIHYYFEKMDAARMDEIIVAAQIDYYYPWKNSENKNKSVIIVEKLVEEMKLDSFTEALNIWNKILTLRWRYNQVRDANFENVTAQTYIQAVEAFRVAQAEIDQKIHHLASQVDQSDKNGVVAQRKYLADEQLYHDKADDFAAKVAHMVSSVGASRSSIGSCDIAVFDILKCQNEFGNYVMAVEQDQQKAQHEFKANVENLTVALISGIQINTDLRDQNIENLKLTETTKSTFIAESDIEALLLKQSALATEFQILLEQLRVLEDQKAQALLTVQEKSSQSVQLNAEYETLVSEASELRTEAATLANQMEAYCGERQGMYEEMEGLDNQILNFGGMIKDPARFNSPCKNFRNLVLR